MTYEYKPNEDSPLGLANDTRERVAETLRSLSQVLNAMENTQEILPKEADDVPATRDETALTVPEPFFDPVTTSYGDAALDLVTPNLTQYAEKIHPGITPRDMRYMLEAALFDDSEGKVMLRHQAQLLDMMFQSILSETLNSPRKSNAGFLNDLYGREKMALLLRIQQQATNTLNTLSAVNIRDAQKNYMLGKKT